MGSASAPVTLSVEQVNELVKKLATLRHDVNGDLALVEATAEAYREKGRFTPTEQPDHSRSKAWAYPVVANGRLFIHDFGTLWCYDIKDPKTR